MNFAITVLTVFGVCAVALGHVVPPRVVEDILEIKSRAATGELTFALLRMILTFSVFNQIV